MSNPTHVTLQLEAAVADGICQSQKPLAAGALTLNGSLVVSGVAVLDVARRVLIGSDADDSTHTFTITGTDRYGNTQSERLAGPASPATVYSVLDYKTVTSVTIDAAATGNITVGTNGVASTAWVQANWLDWGWFVAIACKGPAGTNYSVEHTYDDFNQTQQNMPYGFSLEPASNVPPEPWTNPVINNVSEKNEVRYVDWVIYGFRLTVVSGTGAVTMWAIQAGRGSGPA